LPAAIYPESQGAAEDVVAIFRQRQAEVGVVVDEHTPWAMEDYAVACHARLKPIDDFILRLLGVARKIFKVLWPEVAAPVEVHELTTWLATASGHVDEWRASAAQAGVEMALSFVLSWYDEVQLSQIGTRRAGVILPSAELRARACAIASYVDTEEFIANPDAAVGVGAGKGEDEGAGDNVEDFGGEGDGGAADNDEGANDDAGSGSGEPQF
jgi:hypothetical protein